ncbi:MAG: hypothetical protein AAFN43_06765 [Pseudomonadota bacterium]
MDTYQNTAKILAALYTHEFGGKASGRYRISGKQMRELLGKRRIYPEDVTALSRALLEEGFVLIDMDSFHVVLSANAFVNYRRVNSEALAQVSYNNPGP